MSRHAVFLCRVSSHVLITFTVSGWSSHALERENVVYKRLVTSPEACYSAEAVL